VTTPREQLCTLFEEIGLPAVRIKSVSGVVIEYNGLFSSLINNATAPLDYRRWFVEGVLPQLIPAERSRWEAALADRSPVQVHVAFSSVDGRVLDFEMRSSVERKKSNQSILCIFIPCTNPLFERVREAHVSEGRALERRRIREELHKGVSQQLLGAAFGCRLLAGKLLTLNEDFGKEASDLAELLNEAVLELQNVVHSSENQG
jgi:signal transduction histidine kinase